MQEHLNSFVVEGSPTQVWSLWPSIEAPDFELDGDEPVSWKRGQIRGPSGTARSRRHLHLGRRSFRINVWKGTL